MQIMRSMNMPVTIGIIIFLIIGFIVPSAIASFITYPDDGVWEDSFEDNTDVYLKNCVVANNEIVLKQDVSQISYDFAKQSNHLAYAYPSFFFLPTSNLFSPEMHLNKEYKFGSNDIYKITKIDKNYANRTSYTFRKFIVHHFRFHVDINVESVDYVNVLWNGKANTNARINFYYWNSSRFLIGGWQLLGGNLSSGTDISVSHTIPGGAVKYAVDKDNYIDISVVAYFPVQYKPCTLSTDYAGLITRNEEGYSLKYGIAETKHPIDPINISLKYHTFYWDLLAWDDYQQAGAKVRYQVLYANETGKYVEVENSTLPGNHEGFTISPVFLNNLSHYTYRNKYNKIKIRANLTTDSPLVSPRIFSWAVTWQNGTRWQDSFSTDYRIDQRTKINNENGTLVISQIQDEWPLFGFDSGNTRASNSKGAKTSNLYWFSAEYVGGGFRNPVIGNGKVYISSDKRSLHVYNVTLPVGSSSAIPHPDVSSATFDYDLVNSPAVTDDYVIVATGQQEKDGHENHIYAYKKDNLTFLWDYSYGKNICYDASPVVVDKTIYISTWGGDNGTYLFESSRYTNNKLLALNVDTGVQIWEYGLPAASLSTPAVTADIVIVGCSSTDNDSVFALTLGGEKLWSRSIGPVGHASPVVYEDTVFMTCEGTASYGKATTKIVALNLNSGDILWNVTVGELPSKYKHFADSTPAVYDNILYVASPNGTVYALTTVNGSVVWSSSIYTIPAGSTDVLLSSPAYAENQIYIGTPAGKIMALNATTGKTTWENETFPIWTAAPILGSPIVSNGLVFIADENGVLYSFGKFIASTNEVTGSITSVPIRLPEAYWWNTFYADVSYNAPLSSVKFKLLDENGNILKDDITNKSSLSLGDRALNRTIRLRADFSAKNLSKNNPKLFRWYITLTIDSEKPFLNRSSFTPDPNGWLPEIVPSFTIRTKDNITGLRVKSARYTLEYTLNNVSQRTTELATCTGENGTKAVQLITMNISALPFFNNITALHSIMFNITDLAGNTASKTVTFKQDTKKPTSYVLTKGMQKKYNSTYVLINATANDTGTLNVDASGVKLVELYYRYSQINNFTGDWILFANSTRSHPTWKFNFTNRPNQHGGYFELCTVAVDNASHIEDFPPTGDVSFLYDWKAPELPSFSGDTLWFKERPQFSVVFKDDFLLDTIRYRPNFDTVWTTIATHVNSSNYNTDVSGNSWSLKEEYWDQMVEGEVNYLYFKINDTLGNTLSITSNSQAIIIRKDISAPSVSIDVPSAETEWNWADNFTVSGLGNDYNGSGIKEALLYYRFSEDKSNWGSWTTFGDTQDSSPFVWDFNATKGDGYYEVKINVTDYAGNVRDSDVFSFAVASFPTTLALVLIGLVIVFLFICTIIFIKWRKRK